MGSINSASTPSFPLVKSTLALTRAAIMSIPLEKSSSNVSYQQNEITKEPADPTLAIYLEFAAKDAQWKSLHTKRLLRKVDFRLLPLLVMMYLLNFLDRSNLAQARLGTLEKDLGMEKTDFNLATSILFVVCTLDPVKANRSCDTGLHFDATSIQSSPYSSQTLTLPRFCNGGVGCCICGSGSNQDFWRFTCMPSVAWFH
jgi:hypothetical protein